MEIPLILAFIIIICWAYFKVTRRHLEKCAENIPGDRAYPLIGNMVPGNRVIGTASDTCHFTVDYGRKYRECGLSRFWVFHMLFVCITEPKYVEAIAHSPYAADKGPIYSWWFGPNSKGLFVASGGKEMRALRKPLTRMLSKGLLESDHHKVFVIKNKRFIKHLKDTKIGIEFDVLKEIRSLTFDIFCETHLGVETNEIDKIEKKINVVEHILQYVAPSGPSLLAVQLKLENLMEFIRKWKQKENFEAIRDFVQWVFEERAKEWSPSDKGIESYYPDFLMSRREELNMTTDDMMRGLPDIILAGSDTIAVVASNAIMFLAMFPEIQELAYKEQISIFGKDSCRDPTPKDLHAMKYLTMVIKEALRHSVPAFITKHATGNINIDNYTIPKGSWIMIIIETICKDAKYWEQPESFYPEHFLPDKEEARPNFAFTPFGVGPRICPGSHYGMNSVKTILSFVILNFRMSTSLKYEDIIIEYNILSEMNSYNIKFEER